MSVQSCCSLALVEPVIPTGRLNSLKALKAIRGAPARGTPGTTVIEGWTASRQAPAAGSAMACLHQCLVQCIVPLSVSMGEPYVIMATQHL